MNDFDNKTGIGVVPLDTSVQDGSGTTVGGGKPKMV
jgi:hypothetical protein